MTFDYKVNWEMDDDFIDWIVNNVIQGMEKNGSPLDENIDECLDVALTNLSEKGCDKFNIDSWYGTLYREVKKRCKEQIKKSQQTNKKRYYVEIVNHILIEDDNPLFERIIARNCNGIRQDDKDIDDAIDYIEKRMGLTFQGVDYPPVGTAQISAVYREDGEPVLEA